MIDVQTAHVHHIAKLLRQLAELMTDPEAPLDGLPYYMTHTVLAPPEKIMGIVEQLDEYLKDKWEPVSEVDKAFAREMIAEEQADLNDRERIEQVTDGWDEFDWACAVQDFREYMNEDEAGD